MKTLDSTRERTGGTIKLLLIGIVALAISFAVTVAPVGPFANSIDSAFAGNSIRVGSMSKVGTYSTDKYVRFNTNPGIVSIRFSLGSNMLDLPNARQDQGLAMQTWGSNNTIAQRFNITQWGSNKYLYRIQVAGSGKYLKDGLGNGRLVQTSWKKYKSQLWYIIKVRNSSAYMFKNYQTGKYISVPSGRMGTKIGMTQRATAGSRVYINSANLFNGTTEYLRKYDSISWGTGMNLDVRYGSTANGATVQTYWWNATSAQKWQIVPFANGMYYIKSGVATNRYLTDRCNGSVTVEANRSYRAGVMYNVQLWRLIIADDGGIIFQNVATGKYLSGQNSSGCSTWMNGSYSGTYNRSAIRWTTL